MKSINETIERVNKAGMSDATRMAYAQDVSRFRNFCEINGKPYDPPTNDTIICWIAYRHSTNVKISSIRRGISAVSEWVRTSYPDYPNPCRSQETRIFLTNCRRDRPGDKKQSFPVRLTELLKILSKIGSVNPVDVRDKALLVLMWFGGLRRSEIQSLCVSNVKIESEGLRLTIPKSKTDQVGAGATIGIPRTPESVICPCTILEQWFEKLPRTTKDGKKSHPLFPRLWGPTGASNTFFATWSDRSITGRTVSRIIERRAESAGITNVSSHSFRSGMITELACSGIEDHRIAAISRHRSMEVLRSYIREDPSWNSNPLLILLNHISNNSIKPLHKIIPTSY